MQRASRKLLQTTAYVIVLLLMLHLCKVGTNLSLQFVRCCDSAFQEFIFQLGDSCDSSYIYFTIYHNLDFIERLSQSTGRSIISMAASASTSVNIVGPPELNTQNSATTPVEQNTDGPPSRHAPQEHNSGGSSAPWSTENGSTTFLSTGNKVPRLFLPNRPGHSTV